MIGWVVMEMYLLFQNVSFTLSPLPPPSKLEREPTTPSTMASAEDDYKAFILPIHPDHGILLLYCTRKKSKGPHHQLPGGHVDKEDFEEAGKISHDESLCTFRMNTVDLTLFICFS